jgi:DNA-binding transcriptional regulator YhcF (GntR family)
MNIHERDKIRYNLLVETYRQSDGDVRQRLDLKSIGGELQINHSEVEKAYNFLLEEGLIAPYGAGYSITLTHYGIKTIESFIRKIDFEDNKEFDSTELYQLKIILDEIKNQISELKLGQEIIFGHIDEAFEESKSKTKKNWKEYFEEQIKDWTAQKLIDYSAQIVLQSLLIGLKVNAL